MSPTEILKKIRILRFYDKHSVQDEFRWQWKQSTNITPNSQSAQRRQRKVFGNKLTTL